MLRCACRIVEGGQGPSGAHGSTGDTPSAHVSPSSQPAELKSDALSYSCDTVESLFLCTSSTVVSNPMSPKRINNTLVSHLNALGGYSLVSERTLE